MLAAKSYQPRFRFGLRGLLVFVGTLCLVCAIIGSEVRRSYVQHQAVLAIQRTGGEAYCMRLWPHDDEEARDVAVRRILCRLFGDNVFGEVRSVCFGPRTKSQDIDVLDQLPLAKVVWFSKVRVTQEHLTALLRFPRVTHLTLSNCVIEQGAVSELGCLRSIESLMIDSPKSTLPFTFLSGLVGLKSLHLRHTTVRLVDLSKLKRPYQLRTLDLWGSRLVGGLGELSWFTNLESLALGDTNVGGEQLGSLMELKRLVHLNISFTSVTDDDVKPLLKSQSLRSVCLFHTNVTVSTFQKLNQRNAQDISQTKNREQGPGR